MGIHPARVTSTFYGTSTIRISDGDTAFMTDGFFSRPSLLRVKFGRISPDLGRISDALAHGSVERVAAILVAHSHHDHAMDAPEVARRTNATLYGSESTLNVGRGWNLNEDAMALIADGSTLQLGKFTVTVFEGEHSPGDFSPGIITTPLTPPCRAKQYRNGGCFSFHIAHPQGSVLIHPSANYVPHKFDDLDVDTLYLGVGTLGKQSEQFQDRYWHHVVEATSPSLIIPVHWDNFGRSLRRPLRPLPRVLDNFSATKEFLARKSADAGIDVHFQRPFETLHPMS
ncbi:MBL fold metallo-hydrolase [Rhodococcus sp. IEGM 1401]|uniref:MBL fold metallo-hydrolase n=1 Tax=unclassified Rhodococcus (in: high G+C Gram-positive bacteria) TaxID=192944 RepID=UPI0022B41F20|nr:MULTISPECIES: MBL fold metallo-hydrolase [unclassified Rhodococcus (in: high G+C Gram-positive bacteria)]MCZ4562879.1 MBL fold metallo-hydrolase [Rhodococcus sp. IEGM 1401]MDI6630181.1 MBL fold metallo-hydrolase [Rhodococcus sp. (in: high G+C Gram-positive bacteria)]MDI9923002.1 MBL fold metallo-hydrolase [Rhodococcus sp. IEGM 1372]MDV8035526.1 MBL fold metallo-hydrolase [Rhodococcus sp. IEGM 1414]